MKRKSLSFTPTWSGSSFEAYAVSYISRHVWRTTPVYDFDDLYQVAWLAFDQVCTTYPHVIEAPHLMALYKRTLFCRVTDLANKRTRYLTGAAPGKPRRIRMTSLHDAQGQVIDIPVNDTNAETVYVNIWVDDAPPLVQELLQALHQPPPPAVVIPRHPRHLNDYFCQLLNLPNTTNILAAFTRWLEGAPTPCA